MSLTSSARKILQKFIDETKKSLHHQQRKLLTIKQKLNAEAMLKTVKTHKLASVSVIVATGSGLLLFKSHLTEQRKKDRNLKRRSSEKVFIEFTSVEYKGQVFMTPMDFLHSVTESNPGLRRKQRIVLTEDDVEGILGATPPKGNSERFFGNLGVHGIISYSDYLFLLSMLMKPPTAFEITFNMLDTDGNRNIDKEEYLIMERIFSRQWKIQRGFYKQKTFDNIRNEQLIDDELGLQKEQLVDTTLMVHFFGKNGTDVLSYDTFKQFALNVQKEVLELEFAQYSHGLPFITVLDFAKLLIRYSYMDSQYEYDLYIDRLLKRPDYKKPQKGITFEEFINFMKILHQLDELYFAIRYYTQIRGKATRSDFHESFRLLPGHNLTDHIIDTVFNIFDADHTGFIVYHDFNHAMKNLLHRGFKKSSESKWAAFTHCIHHSMLHEQPDITHKKGNKTSRRKLPEQ